MSCDSERRNKKLWYWKLCHVYEPYDEDGMDHKNDVNGQLDWIYGSKSIELAELIEGIGNDGGTVLLESLSVPYENLIQLAQIGRTALGCLSEDVLSQSRSRSNHFECLDKGPKLDFPFSDSKLFVNRSAMKLANLNYCFDLVTPQQLQSSSSSSSSYKHFSFLDVCGGPGGFTEYLLLHNTTFDNAGQPCVGFGISLHSNSAAYLSCNWNIFNLFDQARERFFLQYDQIEQTTDDSDRSEAKHNSNEQQYRSEGQSLYTIVNGITKDGDICHFGNIEHLLNFIDVTISNNNAHVKAPKHPQEQEVEQEISPQDDHQPAPHPPNRIMNRVQLVCADGGIETSDNVTTVLEETATSAKAINAPAIDSTDSKTTINTNKNVQEKENFVLILYEVYTMIATLECGGNFLLKLFDCLREETTQLIVFISTLFDLFRITKPITSRPGSSERYLIGKGLRQMDELERSKLLAKFKNYIITCEQSKDKRVSLLTEEIIRKTSDIVAYVHRVNMYLLELQIYSLYHMLLQVNDFTRKDDTFLSFPTASNSNHAIEDAVTSLGQHKVSETFVNSFFVNCEEVFSGDESHPYEEISLQQKRQKCNTLLQSIDKDNIYSFRNERSDNKKHNICDVMRISICELPSIHTSTAIIRDPNTRKRGSERDRKAYSFVGNKEIRNSLFQSWGLFDIKEELMSIIWPQ